MVSNREMTEWKDKAVNLTCRWQIDVTIQFTIPLRHGYKLSAQRFLGSFGWTSVTCDWLMVEYDRPIITNAWPPKQSQKALHPKPVPLLFFVSEIGNHEVIELQKYRYIGNCLVIKGKKTRSAKSQLELVSIWLAKVAALHVLLTTNNKVQSCKSNEMRLTYEAMTIDKLTKMPKTLHKKSKPFPCV